MTEGDAESERHDATAHRIRDVRGALLAWFRRRVPDPAEAEDLTQESFLRVAQRGHPEDVAHFESYLYRTARSVLVDRSRRRGVRKTDDHVPLQADHEGAQEADALRALLAKERLRRVSATLMTMPERTRAIFVLCRLEGMRYAEIATRFGISVSAVQKHMLRAIETLMLHGEDPA